MQGGQGNPLARGQYGQFGQFGQNPAARFGMNGLGPMTQPLAQGPTSMGQGTPGGLLTKPMPDGGMNQLQDNGPSAGLNPGQQWAMGLPFGGSMTSPNQGVASMGSIGNMGSQQSNPFLAAYAQSNTQPNGMMKGGQDNYPSPAISMGQSQSYTGGGMQVQAPTPTYGGQGTGGGMMIQPPTPTYNAPNTDPGMQTFIQNAQMAPGRQLVSGGTMNSDGTVAIGRYTGGRPGPLGDYANADGSFTGPTGTFGGQNLINGQLYHPQGLSQSTNGAPDFAFNNFLRQYLPQYSR